MKVLVWLRNDLRLNDNELLHRAFAVGSHVSLVYIFDEHNFGKTMLGLPKTDKFRAKFLIESVQDLKNQLRERESDLSVFRGKSEGIIASIVEQHKIDIVFTSEEITDEEKELEQKVERAAKSKGANFKTVWQSSLLTPEDLPFDINNLPDVFTAFRKKVEKYADVPEPLAIPKKFHPSKIEETTVPSLSDLGLEGFEADERAVLSFEGGETAGIQRLEIYFFEQDLLKKYKETRNGLLGADYSSKFSAWLANGSLSPRYIWSEVKRYEEERVSNQSTYWLLFELWWREYFKFVALRYGNKIFQYKGIKNKDLNLKKNQELFDRWANAQTGIPFIDANMEELNQTGFMSNRGRQNVASFLVKDLKVDWRWGASYFETKLIDYDVCSNWGNWTYVAGVGNDPRENRYFNIIKQAKQYDDEGKYVKHWLPELKQLPSSHVHTPYRMNINELKKYGVVLGEDYHKALVEL